MAQSHIEDIDSGIAEGLYDIESNRDLEAKRAALKMANDILGRINNDAHEGGLDYHHGFVASDVYEFRVGVDFATPRGASKLEKDSAFLGALAMVIGIEYSALPFPPADKKSTEHDIPSEIAIVETSSEYQGNAQREIPTGDLSFVRNIARRDAKCYGNDIDSAKNFVVDVKSRLDTGGNLFVDIAPESGNIDDMLSLTVEIGVLPGTDTPTQCVHVHQDVDSLAFSIFKMADSIMVRPEVGVRFIETLDDDGSFVYLVS